MPCLATTVKYTDFFVPRRLGDTPLLGQRYLRRRHQVGDQVADFIGRHAVELAFGHEGQFRLAAFVKPEPLIVPIIVANFDRKLTRTTLVAHVHEPFRLSDHVPKPVEDDALFAFIAELRERMCCWVRHACQRAVDSSAR